MASVGISVTVAAIPCAFVCSASYCEAGVGADCCKPRFPGSLPVMASGEVPSTEAMAGGWEQWREQWGYFLASSGGTLGRVRSSSAASAPTGWLWFLAVANWMPCCLLWVSASLTGAD